MARRSTFKNIRAFEDGFGRNNDFNAPDVNGLSPLGGTMRQRFGQQQLRAESSGQKSRQFRNLVGSEELFAQGSVSLATGLSLGITTTTTNSAGVFILPSLQITYWVDGSGDANRWFDGSYFDGSTAVKTASNYEINAAVVDHSRFNSDNGTFVYQNRFSNNSGSTVTVYYQARILYVSNQLIAL